MFVRGVAGRSGLSSTPNERVDVFSEQMAPSRLLASALLLVLCSPLSMASSASLAPARKGVGVAGLTQQELFPSAMHPRTRAAHKRIMSKWKTLSAPTPRTALIPAAFGADPTCQSDSSPAFDSLLSTLLNDYVVGNMSDGIKDLGGAVVDLNGGCYLLSRPFNIPQFYGPCRTVHECDRVALHVYSICVYVR